MKFVYNKEHLEALQRLIGRMMQKVGVSRKEKFLFMFSLINLLELWNEYTKLKKNLTPEVNMRLRIDREKAYVTIIFDSYQDDMLTYFSSLPSNRKKRLNIAQREKRDKTSFVANPYSKWLMLVDLIDKLDYIHEVYDDKIEMEYRFGTNLEMDNLRKIN